MKTNSVAFDRVKMLETVIRNTNHAGKRRDIRKEQQHIIDMVGSSPKETKDQKKWLEVLSKVDTHNIPEDDPTSKYNMQNNNRKLMYPVLRFGMLTITGEG